MWRGFGSTMLTVPSIWKALPLSPTDQAHTLPAIITQRPPPSGSLPWPHGLSKGALIWSPVASRLPTSQYFSHCMVNVRWFELIFPQEHLLPCLTERRQRLTHIGDLGIGEAEFKKEKEKECGLRAMGRRDSPSGKHGPGKAQAQGSWFLSWV